MRRAVPPELVALLVRFQQRLLHHIGGIELALVERPELHAREQDEVRPEALQGQAMRVAVVSHFFVALCQPSGPDTIIS